MRLKHIDVTYDGSLEDIRQNAVDLEKIGAAGMWVAETAHDPFIQSALALSDTTRIRVSTGIVIGLARSPMTIAQQAVDLQDLSNGRFALGLGSQIKPHITRRFSMPWTKPVGQMRELVQSIRAIWDHWYDEKPLNFIGEHYQLTFNATAFRREPKIKQRPAILLAAVGPDMLRMAANTADGFICHPFMNDKYLREVITPALDAGTEGARSEFHRVISPNVIIEDGSAEIQEQTLHLRRRMALYGSTPAYRGVLEIHGLGDLHKELNELSRINEWGKMGDLMNDDVLDLFCVRGSGEHVVQEILSRYREFATTIRLPFRARTLVPLLQSHLSGRSSI